MKEKYYLVKIEPTENGTFAMHLHPQLGVAPIVHAHWIGETDDLFPADSMVMCSNCGEYEYLSAGGNYCGNCGAKMDEEVSE